MGVEAHRWHALGCCEPADDGWRSPVRAHDADIRTAQIHKQLHDALRAALNFRGSRRIRTNRLDGNECFQIGEDARNLAFDLITQRHESG